MLKLPLALPGEASWLGLGLGLQGTLKADSTPESRFFCGNFRQNYPKVMTLSSY